MGWADFGPKMDWADFGPNTIILFWARPGPEDRSGPGSAWPKPKRAGGIIFPPPLHAERYSFCMQRRKRKKNARMRGKKSYLAGARWVRGGWSASVFSRWAPGERGAGKKIQIKASFFLLHRCMFGGKKKEEQCRSKRHRSALSLFFFLNV